MLILPIKKKWFEMILSGEKTEEYREIKTYYSSRFVKAGLISITPKGYISSGMSSIVIFRNGYSRKSPYFRARVMASINKGKTEWGAKPEKKYFVLTILSIEESK